MIDSVNFTAVVTGEDIVSVARLAADIWPPHFGPIIGLEQVEYMLGKMQSVPAITEQIAGGADYYLLLHDSQLAGYLGFEVGAGRLLLSKLYLAPEFRGRGLGRRALEFVESCAIVACCNAVELRVNKYNHEALLAYKKWGFTITGSHCLDIGAGYVMDDYCMHKPIALAAF
jgi:GNAT superfamily N-acetyltransferase